MPVILSVTLFTTALLGLSLGGEVPAVRVLPARGLKMESVALLVSGEQGGSIHVAVLPLLFPGAAGRVRVPVVLEIDGATLLKGNTGDLLRVEVCLYAVAKKPGGGAGGRVEGSLLETIEADLARAGSAVERSGLQYAGELSLAPGEYSLRALVRNAQTGEVGLRFLNLPVPDPAAGPLVLAPAFPNPAPSPTGGPWVAALSQAARTSPAVLEDGGLPVAQPVLGLDQEARFEVPVWKLTMPASLQVEVLRPDGGRAAELPARIVARREAGGVQWITVSFVLTGLEQGRYQIRVANGQAVPAWASPFVLLAGGGEGKVWAELLHEAQRPPREGGRSEPPRARRRRLDAAPIREAYRKALRLLAGGEEAAARRAVAELEAPLFAGSNPATAEDIAAIELSVVRDLAAPHPQSLLPVALLHASLYRDAQQSRDFLRAAHTRELVASLAALYAERTGDDAGRRTAARILLGFASHFAETTAASLRDRILRQALTYDRDDAAAHLYLAATAERESRYPEAVAHLEQLLRLRPEDAEARLRLAVSLRRLGKPADADRLLDGLIREPAASVEPWVLALAYQESGRALLAAGRLDEAERSLRAGLERLPGDEKLLLELASVLDARKEPEQASDILASFQPGREAGDGAESPRHRYSRVSSDALDHAWNDFVRTAPEGLPALAAALNGARKGS